jgi:hypothetical protein
MCIFQRSQKLTAIINSHFFTLSSIQMIWGVGEEKGYPHPAHTPHGLAN